MQFNGGGRPRGQILLVGGVPGGRRRQPVRPEAALALLATVPTEQLLDTEGPATVLQLADPADPQLLLAHLRAAAATPGPLLVYLVGQLTADRRRREPHLALARTSRDNVRYSALPWTWLATELGQRPVGGTTVMADLVADEQGWSALQEHGPDLLTRDVPLWGQVSPPRTAGDGFAPAYTRALVELLRHTQGHVPLAELHHRVVAHAPLPDDALLLSAEYTPAIAAAPAPAAPTVPPTPAVPPRPVDPPRAPRPADPPRAAVPQQAVPDHARASVYAPAPVPAPSSPPPPPPVRVDPRPAVAAAIGAGRFNEAGALISDWERELLRGLGPQSPELADVAEARAQCELAAGDPRRATERWILAAQIRMRHLPPDAPELLAAVDNAHALWSRLDPAEALPLGPALVELRRSLGDHGDPHRESAERRLKQLQSGTPGG